MERKEPRCCLCFTLRTGFLILGTLIWIGCVAAGGNLAYDSYVRFYTDSGEETVYPWLFWVAFIIPLILGCFWCRVVMNENKPKDFEIRKIFWKVFMIFGVIINAILTIAALVTELIRQKQICEDEGGSPASCTHDYRWALAFAFVLVTTLLQLGAAQLAKEYADFANPAIPHAEHLYQSNSESHDELHQPRTSLQEERP